MRRTSAANGKNRSTRAVRRVRKSMNGKSAKRLRKIAKALELNPETKYGVIGKQHYIEKPDGEKFFLPQTKAMDVCQRKAYKVAKQTYKTPV